MTNLDKWRFYCQNLFSPQSYIDAGWLFCVNAALQRRVWIGSLESWAIFPNLYLVLVGPPAVGKGLVLSACKRILTKHRWVPDPGSKYSQLLEAQYLFPPGPSDITYQALCKELSASIRRFTYKTPEGEKIYSHSSMAFVLPEIKSLFKRQEKNDKLPTLLLTAYDCEDYDYITITRERDLIRAPCLSLFGGCVPEWLLEAYTHELFTDGFVSRTIFIFETCPRIESFHLQPTSGAQEKAFEELSDHLLKLSTIFGPLNYQPDTFAFLEDWYKNSHIPKVKQANPKMQTYLGRKRAHLQKIAMAFHFSEKLDLTLTTEDFQKAIEFLDYLETNMDLGFRAVGRNVYAGLYKNILKYIESSGKEWVSPSELLIEFHSEVNLEELVKILAELVFVGKLKTNSEGKYATN